MAHKAIIHDDDSYLSRLDRALFRLETLFAMLSGFVIFSLMLLAVASVGGRNVINTPLPGYVDIIEMAMPLIAYGGLAYCHRLGGHVRMDVVIHKCPPRLQWSLEIVLTLLTITLVVALIWGSYQHFLRSFDWAAPLWSRDSSLDLAIPLWPMKLFVPVAFSLLLLRLAIHLWAYCHAFIHPERVVAIPMPERAEDIASREASRIQDN